MSPITDQSPENNGIAPTSLIKKVPSYEDTEMQKHNDVENVAGQLEECHEFKQGLHQRHIQMIALAGTVGTGLFLSSGRAIVNAGPLGAFLAYSIIGATASSVVFGVGEMGALAPLNGGVIRYAEIFCDPALAFANGWNQVYSYIVSIPSEIVAAAVIIEFWVTVNNAIWITVLGLLMLSTAFIFVRVYGELEFGFSILKIMLVIGINIMALVSRNLPANIKAVTDSFGRSLHVVEVPTESPLGLPTGETHTDHSFSIWV
jgi:amino acid transporter